MGEGRRHWASKGEFSLVPSRPWRAVACNRAIEFGPKPLTKSSARSISGMRPGASQLFLQRTHLKKLAMSFSYISVSFCYGYGSVIAKYCYINYKWNLVWQSDKYLEIFGKFCSFWQKFLPNLEIKNLPLLFSQNYAPAKIKNNKLLGIT